MRQMRVSVASGIEAARLPRIIGGSRAREPVLAGDIVSTEDAPAAGFIGRPVAPTDLDGAVDQCLTSLLSRGPSAVRAQTALSKLGCEACRRADRA